MSLPEQVTVGPYTYTVERQYKESNWGHIDHTQQRITLDQDISPERLRVALLHELLHACTEIGNVTDDSTEERTVTVIAPLLLQALRANPALVAFLTAEDA